MVKALSWSAIDDKDKRLNPLIPSFATPTFSHNIPTRTNTVSNVSTSTSKIKPITTPRTTPRITSPIAQNIQIPSIQTNNFNPFGPLKIPTIGNTPTLNTQSLIKQPTSEQMNKNKSLGISQSPTVLEVAKDIVSSLQQGAANLADTGVMANAGINQFKTDINPFLSKDDRNKITLENYYNSERARNIIKGGKTITGESLNPTPDFQFTGNTGRDVADLAGRALNTGMNATMLIPGASLAKSAATNTSEKVIPTILKNTGLFSGLGGLSSGLSTYGQTGDVNQALNSGVNSASQSALTQLALGVLGKGTGMLYKDLKEANARPDNQAGYIKIPGKKTVPESNKTETANKESAPQVTKTPTTQYLDKDMSQRVLDKTFYGKKFDDLWLKWFHDSDASVLPAMHKEIQQNPALKDAGISRLYDYYKYQFGDDITFDEFLNKDIKLYRGGNTVNSAKNPLNSYTVIERKAKRFGDVSEITIKPKDTYGMLGDFSEGEVLVPNKSAPQVTKTDKIPTMDEVMNDPIFQTKPPANDFQDILPSKSRPESIRNIVKNGGNPLYHDTNANSVIGILDSGEIRPSQAPFSQIAGQGKRVSTTRNFDNYSRYDKSPYRFVIDESKTGQRSIPDNREEFESIFKKPVKTNSIEALAIDTTNPAILDDVRSGKLAEVIAKAKEKGIKVETFEGKILPDKYANKEIQAMTKAEADKVLQSKLTPQVTKTAKVAPDVKPAKETLAPIKPKDKPAVETEVVTPKRKYAPKTAQSKLPPVENTGTAKTGEIGKSQGKFSKGQKYEKTSQAASRGRGAIEAEKTNYNKFLNKLDEQEVITISDRDTALAMQKKFKPGTTEHRMLGDLANKVHTNAAQVMATIQRTIRKTSTSKQLTDNFTNKLYKVLDDDRVIDEKSFESVQKKNRVFEEARNIKDTAYDKFQADPSDANAKAFEKAKNDYVKADVESIFEEYNTLAKAIKKGGTKNTDAKKLLDKLRQESGIYFMDYTDANLLSSTRVMLNNYINSMGVSLEESMFGKAGAAIARKLVPESNIGGGSAAGRRLGEQIGLRDTIREAKLRQQSQGFAPIKTMKNIVTTGNTLGDRKIMGTAYSTVYDSYKSELKKKGYTGKELERRARVETLADNDGRIAEAKHDALMNVGLAGWLESSRKLESVLTDKLANKMGGSTAAKIAAKTIVRNAVGFPTVTVRGAMGGAKRSTLGVPTAIRGIIKMKSDPTVAAMHFKNAFKEAGSGVTMMTTGLALGSMGLISGAYPTDKDEQEEWKREGKSEYSIKIGKDWYNIPQALGVFSLPFMIGANAAKNIQNGKPLTDNLLKSTWDTMLNLTPADQFKSTYNLLTGKGSKTDTALAQFGSGVTKTITPMGSLLNQVAKAFDPTANDTTKGDALEQFISKVRDGIPGLNVGLPDKKVEGNVIQNPEPIARMMGAVSKEQSAGTQKSAEIAKNLKDVNKQLNDNGAFSDSVRNILDDETKVLFDTAKTGGELDESDTKKLVAGITKGVSATEDTRFLEDGNYDANLAVLKTKLNLLKSDPTTTNSTLDSYDKQIKRGEVYKLLKVPYDLISLYEKTNLSDWRDMGDSDSDNYDPDTYEKLYSIDSALKASGASLNSKSSDKNKYSVKKSSYSSAKSNAQAAGNAKAAGNAMITAMKYAPTAKLPSAPKISKPSYKKTPTLSTAKSTAVNKYAPIKLSVKSASKKKDKSRGII